MTSISGLSTWMPVITCICMIVGTAGLIYVFYKYIIRSANF
jgi:hypothetical protein